MAHYLDSFSELLEEDFDKEIEVSTWTTGLPARLVGLLPLHAVATFV